MLIYLDKNETISINGVSIKIDRSLDILDKIKILNGYLHVSRDAPIDKKRIVYKKSDIDTLRTILVKKQGILRAFILLYVFLWGIQLILARLTGYL